MSQHHMPRLNDIHIRLLRQIDTDTLPNVLCTRDTCELRALAAMHLVVHTPNPGWHLTDAGRAQLDRERGVA